MAKGKQGYERGAGVYSQVGNTKDPIRQDRNSGDKPFGSPRELRIDTIDRHSDAARKLPKDAK